MSAIDPTTTPAWAALDEHAEVFNPDLRSWFQQDPERAQKWTKKVGDLYIDLSKNLINEETLNQLLELADQTEVFSLRDAMLRGDRINVTENRSVLHTALRRARGEELIVDGRNVVADVREVLDRVYSFANRVRSGEWLGVTGKRVATVVNVGIGGSDLGPVMAYEALKPYVQEGLECRFISNIDPTDVGETTKDLDPETTLVIVASKTFTTLETITNAHAVRDWFLKSLRASRTGKGSDFQAFRCCLDGIGQGRRIRYRSGKCLRFLELGWRPLLGRFRNWNLPGHRNRS